MDATLNTHAPLYPHTNLFNEIFTSSKQGRICTRIRYRKKMPTNQGELNMTTKKKPTKKAPAKKKAVAKKAPVKKVVVKKAPVKKTAAKKTPAKKKKVGGKKTAKVKYTPEQVYSLIEQAAYFAAVNDGFQKGPASYWLQAEAEVNAMVKA